MGFAAYILTALAAYLLGSIPTGFLVARARGIDIRAVGSGNIGATNVLRALGLPTGLLVLALDALKGCAACAWLAVGLRRGLAGADAPDEPFCIVAGLAAILGHNFTCWLGFRGGKGIATSAGVLAALVPGPLAVIAAVWAVVFAAFRYVSLASIAAALTLPVATWLTGHSPTMIAVTAGMTLLALFKHRDNLERLRHGTEHRFGRPKRQPQTAA